jgi:hypothetical protein
LGAKEANGAPPKVDTVSDPRITTCFAKCRQFPYKASYSPLWAVRIYDNAAFSTVMNPSTASAARILEPNGPTVNCPIVSVE